MIDMFFYQMWSGAQVPGTTSRHALIIEYKLLPRRGDAEIDQFCSVFLKNPLRSSLLFSVKDACTHTLDKLWLPWTLTIITLWVFIIAIIVKAVNLDNPGWNFLHWQITGSLRNMAEGQQFRTNPSIINMIQVSKTVSP